MKFSQDALVFLKDGKFLIDDSINFRNGKALPTGWSCRDIFHGGKKIGVLYCGFAQDMVPEYSFRDFKKGDEVPVELEEILKSKCSESN